jgi:hypothetical protein
MIPSMKLEMVFALFMWKQKLKLLKIKPLLTHLRHAPHFPERLKKIILIAKFLTKLT